MLGLFLMEKKKTIKFLILLWMSIQMVSSLQPLQFLDLAEKPKRSLCDIGCKCPSEGQSIIFLDCVSKDIPKLPNFIQLNASITNLSFRNNLLEHLETNTFSKVDSIEELDLSFNRILKIDNFTFVPFKSLLILRISNNHLQDLEAGLLDGLFNLRTLEVGHNSIQRISPSSFRPIAKLQELRLHYNPIFELPEDLFQYLPHLEKLDLQDTGLVRLPYNLLTFTPNLHWLSLSNNAFENVPEQALSKAHRLECLDLSGNDFIVIQKGAFRGLSSISVLYLNNLERLSMIEKDAFAGLVKLKHFSCSYNPKLSYMDPEAFGSLNSTVSSYKTLPREQLSLRQNNLRTLQSPFESESLSYLSYVDLSENPWKCDCHILWMKTLKAETEEAIVCDSPPHLRGRSLDTILASELKCEDRWAWVTFVMVISSMVAFGVFVLGASAIVCSRTRAGLYIRAKKQFSYAKVTPKTETVDLEWDPSCDA